MLSGGRVCLVKRLKGGPQPHGVSGLLSTWAAQTVGTTSIVEAKNLFKVSLKSSENGPGTSCSITLVFLSAVLPADFLIKALTQSVYTHSMCCRRPSATTTLCYGQRLSN